MNKQIEEILIAKNCAKCIHKAVCEKLEEFRDPLCWVDVNGEFGCSYYEKSTDVAREIFEDIERFLRQRYSDEIAGVYRIDEQDFAELKKKYESEGANDE